jgi:histidinol-phosphate aminotransferase
MSRFLNDNLLSLTPYTPGEQPSSSERIIKLNTNESPYPPSAAVMEVVNNKSTIDDLRLYPNPASTQLVEAAAKVYGLDQSQIMVGNGSDEILAFCYQAFCKRGVSYADITYGFYPVWAELYGIKADIVPLREDFYLSVNDYQGLSGTVIIANPNAPTGISIKNSEIEDLCNQDKNRLVIIDEAYVDYADENAIALLKFYDNLLIIRTLSKSYSLAGARIGLAFGSEAIINDLNTIKFSFNPYNLNRLSLQAGAQALLDRDYFNDCVAKVREQRGILTEQLREFGFNVLESSANFIFAGNSQRISAIDYYAALRLKGILVRYFNKERINDFVRISIGSEQEINELIKVTEEILAK